MFLKLKIKYRYYQTRLLYLYLDNYVMLPPEGPNQMSTCGEKRPLDDSQRQSVLVKPANNTNTENIRGNELYLNWST